MRIYYDRPVVRACAMFVGWLAVCGALPLRASDIVDSAASLATKADQAGNNTILGAEGWMYFAPELRHLGVGQFWGEAAAGVSRATKPEIADPLPAIIDFHEQLERAGIELLIIPVPPKAVIYPEHVFPSDAQDGGGDRIDRLHEQFYDELRSHGVKVLDLVPMFMKAKADETLYCRQDTHWSGAACIEVARELKEAISSKPWYAALPKSEYSTETGEVELSGDLWSSLSGEAPPKEKISVRYIGMGGEPVAPDPASPVVLLGDSHNLVFHAGGDMHAVGAGLADQLAFELGFPVDLVAVRGSGATPARVNLLRRARNPSYLAGKKIVIWCFSAREFTESTGWMKVPVVK